MSFQIHSTQSVSARQGVKILVYGASGSGKTRLCGTAPYPLLLSAEGGLLSLRSQNLPFIEITDILQLQAIYSWLKSDPSSRQFQTICLDSLSEIAEVLLRSEQRLTKDGRKAYLELGMKMQQITRDFRDLPMRHVVFTAKQDFTKDDSTGMMHYAPSLPGSKLGAALPYFFDEVFQQVRVIDPTSKKVSEWLRTTADVAVVAKDRSGALAEWEVPNLSAIIGKISGQ